MFRAFSFVMEPMNQASFPFAFRAMVRYSPGSAEMILVSSQFTATSLIN